MSPRKSAGAASGPGVANQSTPALPASIPLDELIEQIRGEIQPKQATEFMRSVYATDRWFTFPKFLETAEYLRRTMTAIGLTSVEVGAAPADGISQAGFWTMPLAWDVTEARLEIVDPPLPAESRVLADYHSVPTSLGMWSGPTPADGIEAEVVPLGSSTAAEIEKLNLRGKLALTDENPAGIKWALVKAGALGAINAFAENPALADGRQWINAWGDNGWAFTKSSTPLLCFSVTPRQSALLRRLLAEHRPVRVRAAVASRYYSGTYPWVTAVIPGDGPEEVLTLGHSSEQGAEDNATGVAALLESLATLNRLIASGKLPKPRRSIRILNMGELYGTMHYLANNPERVRRTVAAMCLDTPAASYGLAGTEYTFYMNPQVASSYVDAFILRVAEEYFSHAGRPWHSHAFMPGTDSYLGEPTIGIPTVWAYSGSGVQTHHNSEDTLDRVDARSLRDISIVNAAYLYYIANASAPEALWLAEVAQARGFVQIVESIRPFLDRIAAAPHPEELGRTLQQAGDHIRYTGGRQTQAVLSVLRLVPAADRKRMSETLEPLAAALQRFVDDELQMVASAANERARRLDLGSVAPLKAVPDPQPAAAAAIIVKRARFGTLPLDDLAPDQREGYPSGAWDLVPTIALYWCDGHRHLDEVIHLTQMELGSTDFDFVGYFKFLQKHGYVEFVQ